jgi:aminopeptidase N
MADLMPEDRRDEVNPLRHQPQGVIGLLLIAGIFLVFAYFASHGWPWEDSGSTSSVEAGAPVLVDPDDARLDEALSEPVEDSVYPEVGDPGVDALHYDLDLTWEPEERLLRGEAVLTFRSAVAAEAFQLDLIPELTVSRVEVDGDPVPFSHETKDLVITSRLAQDERHQVRIRYSGTPVTVTAPTNRTDIDGLGWHITEAGETWTMQEPFGAYSWYPVNDQPADKALYDFTLSVPSPMVGVANGRLTARKEAAGRTTTQWRLAEPASSYLVTTAFGNYEMSTEVSDTGVPITWWTPPTEQGAEDLKELAKLLSWAEGRLGPYPFDTLGLVLVDSESAMETQTMITLGNDPYLRSPEILLHELIHQWYGDQVSPTDWRDLWMNEGMTMYLQGVYEAEQQEVAIAEKMDRWADYEARMRRQSGPPGDFRPQRFGDGNVYYGPALMWHELRQDLGDDRFWDLVRGWPAAHDSGELPGSADRDDYIAWVEAATGEELTAFFDAWLMDARTPPRD